MPTEEDFAILIFPLPVRLKLGAVITGSSMGSISRRLTWERRIPICTKRFPLASGRVLTVPLRFRLKTFTLSPTRSALGSTAFLTLAGVFLRRSCFLGGVHFFTETGTLAFHIADGDAGGLAVFVEIL